jgi:hypothetical protein
MALFSSQIVSKFLKIPLNKIISLESILKIKTKKQNVK